MDVLMKVSIMIAIGALIGGVTNFVAIKMLFRPHQAKYIGKFRVPFTPGLIPKRRDELAQSLGKTVVTHLLTPEGMRKRLLDEQIVTYVTNFAQQEAKRLLRSDQTLRQVLEHVYPNSETRFREHLQRELRAELQRVVSGLKQRHLYDALGEEGMDRLRQALPHVVDTLLVKAEEYVYSSEGELQIRHMTDSFIQRRLGWVAGFIQNVNVTEMIRPEIVNILRGSSTRAGLVLLLTREAEQLSERQVGDFLDEALEEKWLEQILSEVDERLPLTTYLDRSIFSYTREVEHTVVGRIVPDLVKQALARVAENIGGIMEGLEIDRIVSAQVNSLDTSYLEEIVLAISKREFRAITWLGALLGGIIGFVQGMIAIL